ncbi:MAG: FtsX-like permease family protein [Gammaproteobacteria bacterium]|nr:FtsX-like permease family protein [Gammaproteobacteria bacterium]
MRAKVIRLSLRFLRRDWRAGELRVLVAAIVIAVTCVTSVVFFTDRIAQALTVQASELLAADLRIVSDDVLDEKYLQEARRLHLQTASTMSFRSMLLTGQRSQLAEIKAVSEYYPLRGQLKISKQAFDAGERVFSIPARSTVWVEQRLVSQLGVGIGDQISLGVKDFTIVAFIQYEPDRSGDLFSIAPRVLLNQSDLAETELIQEGSRMQYRLLVAGNKKTIDRYRHWVEPQLQRGQRVEDIKDARQEVRIALERSQQFLGLAAIVSVILSCVAVAMSARRYAERHLNTCAIMRCVGARQWQMTQIYLIQIVSLGLLGSAVGCLLGYLAHLGLYQVAGNLFAVQLPPSSYWPIVTGFVVGLVGLLGFALPPLLQLRNVPTLRVFRRELGSLKPTSLTSYTLGIVALAMLVLWQADDINLGLTVLVGVLISCVVLAVVAFIMIKSLKWMLQFPQRQQSRRFWRFGIANITRRTALSITQIMAFGIGIMVLLLLSVVRGDLLDTWQGSLPENASNRFVINIQPNQLAAVKHFFMENFTASVTENVDDRIIEKMPTQLHRQEIHLYPMVRGRLIKVNNKSLDRDPVEGQRANRLAGREFNLSWAEDLQQDNKIIQGKWWSTNRLNGATALPQWSVEEGIAKALNVSLGDTLTYQIAGEEVSAEVTSIRTVQWDTFRANFFVIASPGLLDRFPASYMTSFYLADEQTALLDRLIQSFPNLTVVDISAIMKQVRSIIDRVTLTVEYVFVFTLLAGLTVLYAAIQATQDDRIRENAILRAIGASRKRLYQGLAAEFVLLGLLAGFVASLCATAIGYVLADQVFSLAYKINSSLWLMGVVGGAFGIGLAGLLGTRKVLSKPPLQVIKNIS